MRVTYPFSFKFVGWLFLLTLLIKKSGCLSAESEAIASLTAGVDTMSMVLSEHQSSCPHNYTTAKLENKVAWIERIIENEWDEIETARAKVENASKKIEEMMVHYYSISPTSPPEACAEPFKVVAGSCFWAHKSPGLKWDEARRRCQQAGGDLATPDDIPGVIQFLATELGYGWSYVWMGGRVVRSRIWKWLDSDEEVEVDAIFWHDTRNPGGCTAFNGGRGFTIMAWDCNSDCWYLCEKKIA